MRRKMDWNALGEFAAFAAITIVPAMLAAVVVVVPAFLWFGSWWIVASTAVILLGSFWLAFSERRP